MQFSRLVLFLLISSVAIFTNCSSPAANNSSSGQAAANAANNTPVGPKDNVDEMMLLVNLPFTPEEVAWEEMPEQKKLVAVLRFSSENASKMLTEVAKNGQPVEETLAVESWYPAELIAQGELTGESIVKGQTYPAESFLNPPYTKGKITRIDNTDYYILQMSS